jgi:hypothetical protein
MEEAAVPINRLEMSQRSMKTYILFLLVFCVTKISAQDTLGPVIHKDERIDALLRKATEINEFNTRDARRFVQGYRILVISTNDRNKANEAKAILYRYFPEMSAYMTYQSPNFKLKAGNFKTSRDAEDALIKIKNYFNSSLYVIRDVIEINPDKSVELDK